MELVEKICKSKHCNARWKSTKNSKAKFCSTLCKDLEGLSPIKEIQKREFNRWYNTPQGKRISV